MSIRDRIRDIDGNDVLGFAGAALTVACCIGIVTFALHTVDTNRARVEAQFADCIYLGTRISDTWGQATIYRYHCGYTSTGKRIVEETTRSLGR